MGDDRLHGLMTLLLEKVEHMHRNMATKADIADMATKADIADMATKADIADMATKEDVAAVRKQVQDLEKAQHYMNGRLEEQSRTLAQLIPLHIAAVPGGKKSA